MSFWGISLDAVGVGARLARLRGVLPLAKAPRLVTGVLAVALAAAAAHEGVAIRWALAASATARGPVPSGSRSAKSAASLAALQTLVNAHLFGLAPTPAGRLAAGAPRDASLILTGTIATPDPSGGLALIGASAQTARVHAVGDFVTDGVLLRAVYRDHAVVERAGQLSMVFMPRAAKEAFPVLAAQWNEPAPADASDDGDDAGSRRHEIEHTLDAESDHTGAFLRQQPFYSQGQFRGILIEPGGDPGMLTQLGLKAGDVLQHVDGTMVVDPSRLDMLRERLASGRSVTVSVIRPGVGPVDITIAGGAVAGMLAN